MRSYARVYQVKRFTGPVNDIVRRSLFRKNVHPLKYSRRFASPRENICATRARVVGHPMRVPTRSDPLFPVIQTRRYPVILCVTSNIFLSVNSANNRSVFRLSGDTRRADPNRIHRSRKTADRAVSAVQNRGETAARYRYALRILEGRSPMASMLVWHRY